MEPSPDARSSHHEARNRASTQTANRAAKGRLTACPKSLVATARGPSSHRNVAPIAPLATIHACRQLAVPSIHPYDTARQDYFLAQLSLCTSTAKSFGAQNVGQSRPSSSSVAIQERDGNLQLRCGRLCRRRPFHLSPTCLEFVFHFHLGLGPHLLTFSIFLFFLQMVTGRYMGRGAHLHMYDLRIVYVEKSIERRGEKEDRSL